MGMRIISSIITIVITLIIVVLKSPFQIQYYCKILKSHVETFMSSNIYNLKQQQGIWYNWTEVV